MKTKISYMNIGAIEQMFSCHDSSSSYNLSLSIYILHRPWSRSFHFSLDSATVEASLRVLLISFLSSFWSSIFQVDFGLTTLLLPWGFHFKDWLVISSCPFLKVCNSHLHFLCFIVSLMSVSRHQADQGPAVSLWIVTL